MQPNTNGGEKGARIFGSAPVLTYANTHSMLIEVTLQPSINGGEK